MTERSPGIAGGSSSFVSTYTVATTTTASTTPTFGEHEDPDHGDGNTRPPMPLLQHDGNEVRPSSISTAAVIWHDASSSPSPSTMMRAALQMWQRRTEVVSRAFARLQQEMLHAVVAPASAAAVARSGRSAGQEAPSRADHDDDEGSDRTDDTNSRVSSEGASRTNASFFLRSLARSMRCQAARIAELEARVCELEQQQLVLAVVSPMAAAPAPVAAAPACPVPDEFQSHVPPSSSQRALPQWSPARCTTVLRDEPQRAPQHVSMMMEATQRPSQLDVGELSQPEARDEAWSPGNVTVAASAPTPSAASPPRSAAVSISPLGSIHAATPPHAALPPRGGGGGGKHHTVVPPSPSSPAAVPRPKYDTVKAKYHALKRECLRHRQRAEEVEASWVAQYLQLKKLHGFLRTFVRVPPEGPAAAAVVLTDELGGGGGRLDSVTISLGGRGAHDSSSSPSPSSYRVHVDGFIGRSIPTWEFAQSLVREEVAPVWRVGGAVVLLFSGATGSGRTSLMFDVAVSALEWMMTEDDASLQGSPTTPGNQTSSPGGGAPSWQVDATVADTDDMWSLDSRIVAAVAPSERERVDSVTRRQHATSILAPIFHQRRASYRDAHLVVSLSRSHRVGGATAQRSSYASPRLTLVDVHSPASMWDKNHFGGSSDLVREKAHAQCERDLIGLMSAVRDHQLRHDSLLAPSRSRVCQDDNSNDDGMAEPSQETLLDDTREQAYESCNPLCCLLYPRLTQNRVTHAVLVASVAPHGDPSDKWQTLAFASHMRSAAVLRRRGGGRRAVASGTGSASPPRRTSERGVEYHSFDDDSLLFVEAD